MRVRGREGGGGERPWDGPNGTFRFLEHRLEAQTSSRHESWKQEKCNMYTQKATCTNTCSGDNEQSPYPTTSKALDAPCHAPQGKART